MPSQTWLPCSPTNPTTSPLAVVRRVNGSLAGAGGRGAPQATSASTSARTADRSDMADLSSEELLAAHEQIGAQRLHVVLLQERVEARHPVRRPRALQHDRAERVVDLR